ncbi:MAG: hypothetical protein ACLRZH_13350 [Ruthenibacterium lactatiformans]
MKHCSPERKSAARTCAVIARGRRRRDLNYDKYFVNGEVRTQAEDYTSHNTRRLTVDEVVDKLPSLEYVKEELAALGK